MRRLISGSIFGSGLYRTATLGIVAVAAACAATPSVSDPVGTTNQAATGSCATAVSVDQSLFPALVTPVLNSTTANPFGVAALANFSLETVLDQIVATGGEGSSLTALGLYQQMLGLLTSADCTDTVNGFPVQCPRPEGILAQTNPFTGDGTVAGGKLVPVALSNRFDLAPADGSNCGEYRVVFGMQDDPPPVARFLIIFEATLPNPNKEQGLTACLPVARFWDNLSASGITKKEFASQLQTFYFDGIPGLTGNKAFPPVIRAQNYGIGSPGNVNTGQIRVNMLSTAEWQLIQFELSQSCTGSGATKVCDLTARRSFVGNNPFGELFAKDGDTTFETQAAAFRKEFISQVSSLAATTIPGISMTTPNSDNAGQSNEQDDTNDYGCQSGLGNSAGDFFCNPEPAKNTALSNAIQTELTALGSTLTPEDIVLRATTQSCAGCHEISPGTNLGGGLTWPASEGFTQVDEEGQISEALIGSFLPFRSTTLTTFINANCGVTSGAGAVPSADTTHTVSGVAVGSSD
jgi:hypothetical protein